MRKSSSEVRGSEAGKISRLLRAAVLLGMVSGLVPWRCRAQDTNASSSSKPENTTPIATLTVGWTYLWADQGAGERSNLNGWFVKPSVPIGKGYAVFADFTNYYGANHKGSINSHGFTFGASKNIFTHSKFKPTVFAEAGDVRVSNAGTITNQFAFNAGFNFSIRLTHWVSLAVTPAEWVFLLPNGDPRNDFNAKVGFLFPIGHRH